MSPLAPATEAEAAGIIRQRGGARLRLCGGGTRLPRVDGPSLSARAMTGITRYEPADLSISVRAGTPLAEVERTLKANRQCLAFEPAAHGPIGHHGQPTIGAVVAMNLSGPRRPFAGAARDAVLGLRLITGLGEVITAGGRVLKNVAGLDLSKLVAGSWGSLGLITEVVFKVLPIPEAEATLVMQDAAAGAFPGRIAHMLRSGVPVSGAAHASPTVAARLGLGTEACGVVRLEGSAAGVRSRIERLGALAVPLAQSEPIDLWDSIGAAAPMDPAASDSLWWVSLPPADGGDLAEAAGQLGADTLIDWRGGLVWLRVSDADAVPDIMRLMDRHPGASVRRLHGPPEAVPRRRSGQALDRLVGRVRQALDPHERFDLRPFRAGTAA